MNHLLGIYDCKCYSLSKMELNARVYIKMTKSVDHENKSLFMLDRINYINKH